MLGAVLGGCNGNSKRDQHYGTDAGASYGGPPPVEIKMDSGSTGGTTLIDAGADAARDQAAGDTHANGAADVAVDAGGGD